MLCREYNGSRDRAGYGLITTRALRRQFGTQRVHRVVWILANGPIPPGMQVLHRCDNPPCFLLEHLYLGTNADNMADKAAKGQVNAKGVQDYIRRRRESPTCIHGHLWTPENTYIQPNGLRLCRECRRTRKRAMGSRPWAATR